MEALFAHFDLSIFDIVTRELLLFAGVGLLIGGIDDFLVDLIWIARSGWRHAFVYRIHRRATVDRLAKAKRPGRIAVLIGAWAEGPVIGPMLCTALARFSGADFRIYVGTYSNDPETQAAVSAVAAQDDRVRMVCGGVSGPTTKAECLNRVWRVLCADESTERRSFKAIVLHDAEDVVHSAELTVFDLLIERFDLVQLPVLPLPDPASRWIAGHYCDEFAEAHGRQLLVREAIGASMPSAGVGCAISRRAMETLSQAGNGRPFDEGSLTEDYEIGLRLSDRGFRGIFARVLAADGLGPVAVRAHFPATLSTAVRQKTRWMTGIALAGWDRLGWQGGWAERWMRLRDRRAILAAAVLFAAYLGLAIWALSFFGHWLAGRAMPEMPHPMPLLFRINAMLLCWRALMRFFSVASIYGLTEGACAVLRILPANIIAMLAARRAVVSYWRQLRGETLRWDKTTHSFPRDLPAE